MAGFCRLAVVLFVSLLSASSLKAQVDSTWLDRYDHAELFLIDGIAMEMVYTGPDPGPSPRWISDIWNPKGVNYYVDSLSFVIDLIQNDRFGYPWTTARIHLIGLDTTTEQVDSLIIERSYIEGGQLHRDWSYFIGVARVNVSRSDTLFKIDLDSAALATAFISYTDYKAPLYTSGKSTSWSTPGYMRLKILLRPAKLQVNCCEPQLMSVFPNPCYRTLHVKQQNSVNAQLFAINALGIRVKLESIQGEVDVSALPPGFYVLTDFCTLRERFVKL